MWFGFRHYVSITWSIPISQYKVWGQLVFKRHKQRYFSHISDGISIQRSIIKMQRVTYKSCEARSVPLKFTTGPLHFISNHQWQKYILLSLYLKYWSALFVLYWEMKGHGPHLNQSCEALQLNITHSVIFQLYIFSKSTPIHESVSGIRFRDLLITNYAW